MRNKGLFVVLLCLSWIASSGQIGKSDTSICYTRKELQKIASRVLYANECDSLLKITDEQINNYKKIILNDNQQISKLEIIIDQKESIILIKDKQLETRELELKTMRKKLTWTKISWIVSSTLLAVSALFFGIR